MHFAAKNRAILATLCLAWVFFASKTASAATIYTNGATGNGNLWNSSISTNYTTATTSLVCGFGFAVNRNDIATTSAIYSAHLFLGEDRTTATYFASAPTGSVDSVFPLSSLSSAFVPFMFPTCYTISPSSTFWFELTLSNADNSIYKWANLSPPESAPNRQWRGSIYPSSLSAGYGIWFGYNFSETIATQQLGLEVYGAGLGSLGFLTPKGGQQLEDFGAWSIYYGLTASSTIFVDYGNISTSTFQYTDEADAPGGSQAIPIPKTTNLWSPGLPSSTTWYARLRAVHGTTTIATGDPISFTIRASITFPNTTSTLAGICDDMGDLSGSICSVLFFLFKPPDQIFSGFSAAFNAYKNRPPLGYVTQSIAVFSGIQTSTAAFAFPSLAAFNDFFSPLDIGISVVLSFAFLTWLFHRVKHMDI